MNTAATEANTTEEKVLFDQVLYAEQSQIQALAHWHRGQPYPFVRYPSRYVREQHAVLWETTHLALPHLDAEDLAIVVNLVLGTCSYCHEASSGCRCWDDG